MARTQSKTTTNHQEIRRWAEERGGQPACVKGTGGDGDMGMIRIDFPGYSGEESLQHISWDEWFRKFDESNLALVDQERTSGGERSNFNKLIGRETAELRARGVKSSRHHPARRQARTRAASSRTRTRSAAKRSRRPSSGSRRKAGGARGARTTATSGRGKTQRRSTKAKSRSSEDRRKAA